jgi:hypothetical protein
MIEKRITERLKILNNKLNFCKEILKLLIVYFLWKTQNSTLLFDPEVILKSFLKFFAYNLVELIIECLKNKEENLFDINEMLELFLDIIFRLNFKTSSI